MVKRKGRQKNLTLLSISFSHLGAMSLYQQFKTEIVKKMKEELKLDNVHQVPRIDKVVVSMGIGSLVTRK